VQIFVRGINSVKAVGVLLEQRHWEHAVGVVRQLFELLVNMEYLGALPDRAVGIDRYRQFGLLQFFQQEERKIAYSESTGRSVNPEIKSMIENHLENSFSAFRGRPKPNGKPNWNSSWSGKTTRDLADCSSDRMRPHQYEHLFRVWSEQTHASPGALIQGLMGGADENWLEELLAADDKEIVETVSMTFMLFVSLWVTLPHIPRIPEEVRDWARTIMRVVGAPEFESLPGYRVEEPAP